MWGVELGEREGGGKLRREHEASWESSKTRRGGAEGDNLRLIRKLPQRLRTIVEIRIKSTISRPGLWTRTSRSPTK